MTCRLAVNLLSLVPGDVGGAEEYAVRTLAAYGRHGPADLPPPGLFFGNPLGRRVFTYRSAGYH